MDELTVQEVNDVFEVIGRLGNQLRHLPFSRLRSTREHRFGRLKLWPKKKIFYERANWDNFRYRPLVSFVHHRWRRVFALLSQW